MRSIQFISSALIITYLVLLSVLLISVNDSDEDEIKSLMQYANTPEAHMKIANYYDKQVEKMEEMANLHESIGESYKKRSNPMSGMPKHCADLTKNYRDSAKILKIMATEHKIMADPMYKKK